MEKLYHINENLQLIRIKNYKIKTVLTYLSVLVLCFCVTYVGHNQHSALTSYVSITETNVPLTKENVYKELIRLRVLYPDLVLRQCLNESGQLKSRRALEDNNIFGLKKAELRPSTAIGWDSQLHCIYNNWQDCVIDYALYQAYIRASQYKSEDAYKKRLQLNYAEDKDYVNKF